MKAIIRIAQKRSPVSGWNRGYRLQACVPNAAARKMKPFFAGDEVAGFSATDEMVPAFRGQYLIAESSDLPQVNEADVVRFCDRLKWEGYTEFEKYGKQWDDMGL